MLSIVSLTEEIQNVITKVASNDNLYDRGIALGLDPFIVKNPGQWGITAGKRTMATTMEAIIGAVYYDSAKNGDDLKRVLTALGLAWPEWSCPSLQSYFLVMETSGSLDGGEGGIPCKAGPFSFSSEVASEVTSMSQHYWMSLVHFAMDPSCPLMAASLCLHGWEVYHEDHISGNLETEEEWNWRFMR